jgi:hypothetical protein
LSSSLLFFSCRKATDQIDFFFFVIIIVVDVCRKALVGAVKKGDPESTTARYVKYCSLLSLSRVRLIVIGTDQQPLLGRDRSEMDRTRARGRLCRSTTSSSPITSSQSPAASAAAILLNAVLMAVEEMDDKNIFLVRSSESSLLLIFLIEVVTIVVVISLVLKTKAEEDGNGKA